MRYVNIGSKKVSIIGLGAWQFGSNGWGWNSEFGPGDADAIIRKALELGINFIDTAEMYGGGQSEEIVGKAINGHSSELFLASKVSPHHLFYKSLINAASRSLTRLDVPFLDLYQIHWPMPLIPTSSTMRGMRHLQSSHKIDHIGVSNYSLDQWIRSERILDRPIITNQVSYSLLNRSPEKHLVPYAQDNQRYIIAYSPLAQGLLSGKYTASNLPRGVRLANNLFNPNNVRRVTELIDTLREIGKIHSATPAQIALAWVIHRPNVLAIPGAKSLAQIEQNAAAAEITLSDSEYRSITEASDHFIPTPGFTSIVSLIRRALFK